MKDKTNKMKVRRIGRKRKALPPHTWEAHPTANQGEANKTLIIVIITIIALIALAALLFFSDRFVGEAIFVTPGAGAAGIMVSADIDGGDVALGDSVSIPIMVKMEKDEHQSVAFEFTLGYNSTVFELNLNSAKVCGDKVHLDSVFKEVDKHFIVPEKSLDFSVIRNVSCAVPGKITFTYAGLCVDEQCDNALKGLVTLANITFTTKILSDGTPLKFENSIVYSLADNSNLFSTWNSGYLSVVAADLSCNQADFENAVDSWINSTPSVAAPYDDTVPESIFYIMGINETINEKLLLPAVNLSQIKGNLTYHQGNLQTFITALAPFETQYANCNLTSLTKPKEAINGIIVLADTLIGLFDQSTPPSSGKVSVTELATVANVYKTKITALESFAGKEVTVYTVLYGNNSKQVVIKNEKIENGLIADQTYIVNVPYTGQVLNKSVFVYDTLPDQGQTVYGELKVGYANE
jgi:hypothetical protein